MAAIMPVPSFVAKAWLSAITFFSSGLYRVPSGKMTRYICGKKNTSSVLVLTYYSGQKGISYIYRICLTRNKETKDCDELILFRRKLDTQSSPHFLKISLDCNWTENWELSFWLCWLNLLLGFSINIELMWIIISHLSSKAFLTKFLTQFIKCFIAWMNNWNQQANFTITICFQVNKNIEIFKLVHWFQV